MEEKDMQSPATNGDLTESGSSISNEGSLQKKHQAMIDRLSNRHQSRAGGGCNSSRSTDDDNSDSTTASFASKFSDYKRSIESLLANSSSVDSSVLRSHLDRISSSIATLEQFVAESSYSLPSYELRSALKSVAELKQWLETQSAELVPKKKFSFRNKSATTTGNKFSAAVQPKDPEPPKQQPSVLLIRDSPGFRNVKEVTLTKNFRGSGMGEFTVSDVDSCEVRLIGCINALFFNRLRNCRVYTGPVIGSVLIEQVENCVFVLASHQIRIHNASGCDFYLRVRSRPIIEDCSRVRFAPYCLRYEGIEKELKEAGLGDESGNWANVDDFKWLRAVQSPNWSVLEESQRIECFEINELGDGNESTLAD